MSDDFDFVRLYYTDQCVVDEDCFCELAASCVDGLQRVLTFRGDSDKEVLVAPAFGFFFVCLLLLRHASYSCHASHMYIQLILDRNCTVVGVFVEYEALCRELTLTLPASLKCSTFSELLFTEPHLAFAMLQTTLHTMVCVWRFVRMWAEMWVACACARAAC